MLACKQEETTRNKRYKSTDRSELAIANRQSLRARTNLGSSSAADMIDERNGASGGTRTHYPQFRKLLLYPDELRRRAYFIGYLYRNFKRYFSS